MSEVEVKPERPESSMLSPTQRDENGMQRRIPTLLVLDETDGVSSPLASLLESRGHRVVSAGSGPEAIDLLQRDSPALAIVARDSTETGMACCRGDEIRMAARSLGIPLLEVVEPEAGPGDWIDQSEGNEDWVVRGCTPRELDARIARLLRRVEAGPTGSQTKGSPIDAQFCSLLVHDLRTPLNVIVLSLNMIEHSLPRNDPDVEESIRFIKENYRQIEQMISQLSDYARLFETSTPLSVSEFEPRRLVEALVESNKSRPQSRMSPVVLDIQPTCPTEASLDQLRARMAIEYALLNASAASEGGPVRLTLRGEPQRLVIEVANDQPPRASVTSHRLESHVIERLCGSPGERRGMDLAIAVRITEMFGGTARLEAVKGRGTTVILEWPTRINGQ